MGTLSEQLISEILKKLPMQKFSIKRVASLLTQEERSRLESDINYLLKDHSFDFLVAGYVYMTQRAIEETFYFKKHGDYRFHTFAEVNNSLYSNKKTMELYMVGLFLGEYLWETLLRVHRYYEKIIHEFSGKDYLEIGPGHGKYFTEACRLGRFRRYTAIDVSPTAIQMTEKFLNYNGVSMEGGGTSVKLLCKDVTMCDIESKFDFVVAQEVLEHIENPLKMLKQIRKLLTRRGMAYLLVPISAPSPAHIFLFKDREHVRDIVKQAGLEIVQEKYIVANEMALREAEKRKLPINACLITKRC